MDPLQAETVSFAAILVRFAGAMLVITLPGFALAARFLHDFDARDRITLGAALGIAATVYGGYLLTAIHLTVALIAIVIAAIIAGIYLIVLIVKAGGLHFSLRWLKRNGWIIAIVAGAVGLRLWPVACSEYPLGTDSTFHLILARKIAMIGQLPTDWMPFENVPLNYPTGSHVLVAIATSIANIPLHRSFALLEVALAGVTVALVYVVGRAIFQREAAALWSAFAYAFVAILGSLDYYRWGGLPNLIGMMLLLAGLVLALAGSSRASLGLGAMTFASTYLVHHHTMLVILGICSAVVVVLWYAAHREEARRLVIAVAGSLVLSAFWLIPLAARVVKIRATGTLEFNEYVIWPWDIPNEFGIVFAVLAAPGIIALVRRWLGEHSVWLWTWVVWAGALFVAFIFFEYLYRVGAKIVLGTALTAFTPSRFLTDAVYPLAFAAGWACDYVSTRLAQFKRIGKGLIAVGTALLVVGVGGTQVQRQGIVVIKPDEMAMLQWIKGNTLRNAMILDNPAWLEYVTWREGSNSPLPISEPVNDPRVVYKREALGTRNWAEINQWQKTTGRPVYLVTRDSEINQPGWTRVFLEGPWRIYQLSEAGGQ